MKASDEETMRLLASVAKVYPALADVHAELLALRKVADAAKIFSDCVAAMDDANTVKLGMALDKALRETGR